MVRFERPLFTEAAYPVPEDQLPQLEQFLQTKVGTLTAMRGNYGPHTDPRRILSASVLGTALELVYGSPLQKDREFEAQRNRAIITSIDRVLPELNPDDEPYQLIDEQAAVLEAIDPKLPYAIEILEHMHKLGLEEDIYSASLKALVQLAKESDYFSLP